LLSLSASSSSGYTNIHPASLVLSRVQSCPFKYPKSLKISSDLVEIAKILVNQTFFPKQIKLSLQDVPFERLGGTNTVYEGIAYLLAQLNLAQKILYLRKREDCDYKIPTS